jgi:hypothetical protein
VRKRKNYRTVSKVMLDFIYKLSNITRALREINRTIADLRSNFKQLPPIVRNIKKLESAKKILLESLQIGQK